MTVGGVYFQNVSLLSQEEVSGIDELIIYDKERNVTNRVLLTDLAEFVRAPLGSIAYESKDKVNVVDITMTGQLTGATEISTEHATATDITMSGNLNNALAVGQQSANRDYKFEPRELFHLSSPDAARLLIEADVNNVDENANAQILLEQDGGSVQAHVGFWDGTNSLYLWNRYSENVVIGTNDKEGIRLVPSGDVGIGDFGKSPPSEKLDVQGNVKTNSTVFTPIVKPAAPKRGQMYFDKADSLMRYWDGNRYIRIQDSIPATGEGFTYDQDTASPACVPGTGEPPTVTDVHRNIRACVLKTNGSVAYYLNPADWSKKLQGGDSDLSGTDGNVMIEIPAFYYDESVDGNVRTPLISAVPLPGFKLHPAFVKDGVQVSHRYYGAYDACVYSESGKEYIDGLNLDDNATFINPATGKPRVDPSVDKLASVKGYYPMVGLTRDQFRQLAANVGEGWRQVDYDLVAAVQLLYVIEYQTFFSQSVLGAGNTNGSYVASSDSQIDSPHTIAGAGDSIGTGSTDPTTGAGVNAKPGKSFMKYRGIENFYGNAWNFADGINVNVGETGTVYVTNDSKYFADNTSDGMNLVASALPTSRGYISQLQLASPYFLSQSNSGGSSTTYVTDYHYGSSSSNRVVRVGGLASDGANAGAFCVDSAYSSSARSRSLGARLCY